MRHSVILDKEKCLGCTTCIKQCPTGAIRVRRGKAIILPNRCIDCGQCIRVCPHKAKRAICDELDALERFRYTVALVPSSLYTQFQNMKDIGQVLDGLLNIGFDDVFEVARASEMISAYDRKHGASERASSPLPQISSFCPAVVRLIRMRFPKLIPHIIPHVAPEELAAILARREAVEKTGYQPEEIGIFVVSPCPARRTVVYEPEGLSCRVIDGAFSMNDIYRRLLSAMEKPREKRTQSTVSIMGAGWAIAGGESAARLTGNYVAADGIDNVITMLEAIEDGRLSDVEFVELTACTEGCVGGCLVVENPFVARMRMKQLMKALPVSRGECRLAPEDESLLRWDKTPEYIPVLELDSDRGLAMEKMMQIEKMAADLPGLDCGSCGAPSCHALAEDIVRGIATEEDCIFKVRERMLYMSGTGDADDYLPPPFRKEQ